ncbi:hypothetical protein DLE60_03410 [Micromonospora globispora]|uniref:hypothetical protein n=1 Tax=Micromonospora globispora TaxID=1450148 RepID=UPI000D6F7743|nr:hypothetical protein [Micromonospora globispora]PWU61858.1 hypothetical protein DLE60_03410 [Micromonospora globispora]RQW98459.1 hypothetical protein DKL51_10425 [Micromonospora globispora]
MTAVEAWFLGGPIDGRLMPVETTVEGDLPEVVRMPQGGLYVSASEVAASAEHVYVLGDRFDDIHVYRYQRTDEAQADGYR